MDLMHLNFPFAKVNKEERTVAGVATSDNIDQSGDIVLPEASMKAFQKWIGNIREMHNHQAVGKAIDISPVDVYDGEGNKFFGIEVTSYISKGAEDTWQKVLDGTLRGYSIGGVITSKDYKFIPELNKNVRVITGYELNELSLVDNPDNPLATLSMVKLKSSDMENAENDKMYVCKACNKATTMKKDCCPECGGPMDEMESMDHEDQETPQYEATEVEPEEEDDVYDNELQKGEGYVPPAGVRSAAARGLELRDEFNRGGTMVGVARARDLSNGKAISLDTIRRMVSYFARHEVDKQGQGWAEGSQGYPSAGRIAWLLWGGDEGRAWANKISRQAESETSKMTSNENEEKDLRKNENDGTVDNMDLTKDQKRSLFAKFVNLFVDDKDVEELIASTEEAIEKSVDTEVEVESNESTENIENNGGNDVDLTEVLEKLSAKLDEGFEKAKGEIASTLSTEIDAKIEAKLEEFAKSVDEKVTTSVAEVSERVEKVESAGAMRKSADTDEIEEEETIEKSAKSDTFWNNLLLPQPLIEALGYES